MADDQNRFKAVNFNYKLHILAVPLKHVMSNCSWFSMEHYIFRHLWFWFNNNKSFFFSTTNAPIICYSQCYIFIFSPFGIIYVFMDHYHVWSSLTYSPAHIVIEVFLLSTLFVLSALSYITTVWSVKLISLNIFLDVYAF